MTTHATEDLIRADVEGAPDKGARIAELRALLHELSPTRSQAIDLVRWVPIGQVRPNGYNPNSVAKVEMNLLYTSIKHDSYTQPVVVIWNHQDGVYEIVDGFHRYFTMKTHADIAERTGGLLPVVVIDKDVNDRMASTVRHNRARGKHSVQGMSSMVFKMLENGWEDAAVCQELGMSPEELVRLKHVTGFSKLFENAEYRKAWMTDRQIRIARSMGAPLPAFAAAPTPPAANTPESSPEAAETPSGSPETPSPAGKKRANRQPKATSAEAA